MYHNPVLIEESIKGLNIIEGGIYVDATYGGGGHAKEIEGKIGKGKLFVFDRDAEAIENAKNDEKMVAIHSDYGNMKECLNNIGINEVDGIIADLGVSSHQIDSPHRGFSWRFDSPLDMRMNREETATAADIINTYSAKHLQSIFSEYGELSNARTLSLMIEKERKTKKIVTISDLKNAIETLIPKDKTAKFLSKIFQALRIELNHELDSLKELLKQSAELIRSGGRLVVISYHSLEDRLVKNFMRNGNFEGNPVKDVYGNVIRPFTPLTKTPIVPGDAEILANNRARSAKLRIAEKV
jgi:16S rRNA (cytosine1402-N4)-methyltransferase